MSITVIEKPSKGKKQPKIYYTLSWGRGPGEREATGIFTYLKPKVEIPDTLIIAFRHDIISKPLIHNMNCGQRYPERGGQPFQNFHSCVNSDFPLVNMVKSFVQLRMSRAK